MDINELKTYLDESVPRSKNVENLLKIADFVQKKDSCFYSLFVKMRDYYEQIYSLDKSSFLFRFVMHDLLKEFFTQVAELHGLVCIAAIERHFKP